MMQEFENPLFCMICTKPHNQPSMCPHCSKIFCHQCIINHLANYYFCPSCNNYIIDLVKCDRLLSEVKRSIQKKNSTKNPSQKKKCKKHDLPYEYFCLDCQYLICCDCGLLQKQHQGHQFLNSKKAKEKIATSLTEKTGHINKNIKESQQKLQLLHEKIDFVKTQEQRLINDLKRQFLKTVSKIQGENRKILNQIDRKISKHKDLIRNLQIKRQKNLLMIDKDSEKHQSISFLIDLLKNTSQHSEDQMYEPQYTSCKVPQLSYLNEIQNSLSFESFQFVFEYIEHENGKVWFSPKFNYLGDTWKVKIYPNGTNDRNRQGQKAFISIFVEADRNSSINNSFQFEYAIQLAHPKHNHLSINKQSTNVFNQGDCWGFNKFIQVSQVNNFISDGKLRFKFSVRSFISFEKIRILQINALSKKIQSQRSQNSNYKKVSESPNKKEMINIQQTPFNSNSEQHKLIIKTLKQWYQNNAVKLTATQGRQLISIFLNFNTQSQRQINKLKSELDQTIKAMHQISALLLQKEQSKVDFKSILEAYDSMQQIQSFSMQSSVREFHDFDY